MKYFVTDRERDGTCYHEFYKDDGMAKHFGKRIPYLYMII